MKENLRKLALISRVIDPDLFYCLTVWDDEIKFQGKYSSDVMAYLLNHRFTVEMRNNGFAYASRSNIKIILT